MVVLTKIEGAVVKSRMRMGWHMRSDLELLVLPNELAGS